MKLSMLNLSAKFGLYQAHMTDLCQYTVMIDCMSTTKDLFVNVNFFWSHYAHLYGYILLFAINRPTLLYF